MVIPSMCCDIADICCHLHAICGCTQRDSAV